MRAALLVCGLVAFAPPAWAKPEVPFMAQLVAKSFFRSLVAGELNELAPLCAPQVSFDGLLLRDKAAIKARLAELVKRAQRRRVRLKRVVLLPLAKMKTQYGPPPARLRSALKRGQVVALARFEQLGALAVLQRVGRFWRVVALSD